MMVLEVNNTFDERHIYLLRGGEMDAYGDGAEQNLKSTLQDTPGRFKNAWPKLLHVSPFSSRKGHYSLSAVDPFGSATSPAQPAYDNTIVLSSSKGHPKLIARVYRDGAAFNPLTASRWAAVRFLLGSFWLGFATAPRTLKEAFVLYFRRGLNVWARPEVLPRSLGRHATSAERYVLLLKLSFQYTLN
jgi:DUF1365 family protein